jgi:hypothetical protein
VLVNSLQDILGSKDFSVPDEVEAVKDYVLRRYKSNSLVQIQRDAIILKVPNSSLASTIRLEQNRLIETCHLSKRLVIRWGRLQ